MQTYNNFLENGYVPSNNYVFLLVFIPLTHLKPAPADRDNVLIYLLLRPDAW